MSMTMNRILRSTALLALIAAAGAAAQPVPLPFAKDDTPAVKYTPVKNGVAQGDTLDSIKKLPDWSGMWRNMSGAKHMVGEGRPPYKNLDFSLNEKGAATFAELNRMAKEDTYLPSRMEQCLMLGVPGSVISPIASWQFLFTPGQVTVLSPFNSRKIYTDGRPHGTPAFRGGQDTVTGDSIGHWEKDGVLVVETVSLDPNNELVIGFKQGRRVHVSERIYRKGDTLYDDMTIDAPDILAKPWVYQAVFEHSNQRIADYPCSDNRISRDESGQPVFDISLPKD